MLHAQLRRPPWTLVRCVRAFGPSGQQRLASSFETTIDRVKLAKSSELESLWEKISSQDRATALSLRTHFYGKLREDGLASSLWALSIPTSIPPRITRFADYLFFIDLLIAHKRYKPLSDLFLDLARKTPSMWEQLFTELLSKTGTDVPIKQVLHILLSSCLEMNINLAELNRAKASPIVDIVLLILSKYDTLHIMSALEALSAKNPVQAPVLATALLRALCESIVDINPPPTLMELSTRQEARSSESGLPARLWAWKVSRGWATSEDLKIYMLWLVYSRKPRQALKLYDSMPALHNIVQLNEAVLLSASVVGDFERLQLEFEKVEKKPKLIEELGSRRYAIVLKALGFVGNASVLDNIYRGLSVWHPRLRTRGIYHALIYSHGLRGDLKSALKVYGMMLEAGITPTMSTFSLILRVYRDTLDLPGFISFLGNEVIDKHQFPLRNGEVSTALSLCSRRRDYKSAQFVWKWATGLLTPDARTWNAYLHCFVTSNQFDEVQKVFGEIEKRGTVDLHTLTILMGGACRYSRSKPDVESYVNGLLRKKEELHLDGDETWYLTYLSVLAELGSVQKFEAVFKEMKQAGIAPHASHFAVYTELLAKSKNFAKNQSLSKEMRDRRVPINFAFIEKYLRMLTAPGTTAESRKLATDSAFTIVKNGYFDPWASTVPRGAVPVRVIEPVVHRLLKTNQLPTAKRLLDGLLQQRASESEMPDDYMLWALSMRVAHAAKNTDVLDSLWAKFASALRRVHVLVTPKEPDSAPRYSLPRRYRYNFANTVDIRIKQIAAQRDGSKLLELPSELESLGISMDDRNTNSFISALAAMGLAKEAYAATVRAQTRYFKLTQPTKYALLQCAESVDLAEYGNLGEYIRRRKLFKT